MRESGASWGSGGAGAGAGAGVETSAGSGGATAGCFAVGRRAGARWRCGRAAGAGRDRLAGRGAETCRAATTWCATVCRSTGSAAGLGAGGTTAAWAMAARVRRCGWCATGGSAVAPAATDAVTIAPTATFAPGENASAAR